MTKPTLIVNGERRSLAADANVPLVRVLRDELGLKGVHEGCETAQCGACTVLIDGRPVKACTVLAGQAAGLEVTTIEGASRSECLTVLQQQFSRCHALQCGFCTPGMILASASAQVMGSDMAREALRGNLCRCTGYQNIVDALGQRSSRGADEPSADGSAGRREDARLIRGLGCFTDDLERPGQAHAKFLRAPAAHARIKRIDSGAALAVPGVLAVYTAREIAAAGLGRPRCHWRVEDRSGESMRDVARPLLADEIVRFSGEAVALIVAESSERADAGAAAINVEYEVLPANTEAIKAEGAAVLHDEAPANTAFHWTFGDEAATAEAFSSAAHVTQLRVRNNRVQAAPMETRAALAEFDPGTEHFTLHVTTQNPHVARRVIAEDVGLAPEHQLDVISQDVGGSFGSKIFVYGEECLCLWAARELGRPVRWRASREECFSVDVHGRDQLADARLALDASGRFLAIDVRSIANLGAYLSSFGAIVPTFNFATMLIGPYLTPELYCEVKGVYTNTAPVDAYRGAGRPEAVFILESLIDEAARETGRSPIELRRINTIPAAELPYLTPAALVYDSGDFSAHLETAIEHADLAGFEGRRAVSEARGKRRGIGVAHYLEAAGIGPSAIAGPLGAQFGLWEVATLRFDPTGSLQIVTGAHAQGQGHETAFATLAAERFGLDPSRIRVHHGDTRGTPMGMGTYGSRSLVVGGSAIVRAADQLIEKGRLVAAWLLDCDPDGIVFAAGRFEQTNGESCSLADVVRAAYAPYDYPEALEPGMEATVFYDPVNFTFPSGTHVCELEVDPETGVVQIQRYTAVDDFGRVVREDIVAGQMHGGITQGIGQALMEEIRYDSTGALVTNDFWSYAVPRAEDLPRFDLHRLETRAISNPVGAKGCGEAGAIAAPPAVMNALTDALGVRMNMPATPERVWRTLRAAPEGGSRP